MAQLSVSRLEGARSCVRPEYSVMSAKDLEQVVERSITGLPADAAEDFMSALGSLGKTIGSGLQAAAPTILPVAGTAVGTLVGGPVGTALGGKLGSLAAGAIGPAAGPTAPIPGIPAPAAGVAALPTGQGAAATLLGLLQNPTVQQALLSQILGAAGSQRVLAPSGTSLPRAAVNSLLTQLLANASESLPEAEAISDEDYLRGERGEYLVDPASPEQTAALVLSHLRSARRAESQGDSNDASDARTSDDIANVESIEWSDAEDAESAEFY